MPEQSRQKTIREKSSAHVVLKTIKTVTSRRFTTSPEGAVRDWFYVTLCRMKFSDSSHKFKAYKMTFLVLTR